MGLTIEKFKAYMIWLSMRQATLFHAWTKMSLNFTLAIYEELIAEHYIVILGETPIILLKV
jgi:hypothetical protein